MELVMLSTLAAIAILLAELLDLAVREPVGRPMTVSGTSPGAGLAAGSSAANDPSAAPRRELERAA